MILLIDNYDSFTYNVYQYLGELGADVSVIRNDEITVAQIERLAPEKIVVSPGPCTPNEAGISLAVIERFAGEIPLLGICLGHQAIGQAFGGEVRRARTVTLGEGVQTSSSASSRDWCGRSGDWRCRGGVLATAVGAAAAHACFLASPIPAQFSARDGPRGARWTPTAAQLARLEELFATGMGTPNGDLRTKITDELAKLGPVNEANVYNWFQNKKARTKKKLLEEQAAKNRSG